MAVHQDRAFEDIRSTVHEYARLLRRRWRLALVGACAVSAAAFWASQYLPRQYGTTTLFERRDDAVLQNLIHSNSPYSFGQLRSTLKLDMTGSRALAEAALATGLLPPDAITSRQALTQEELNRLEAALKRYAIEVSVRLVQSSPSLDTVELDCAANDPVVAGRFAAALRDGYVRRTRERITQILLGARDFFANEVERFQAQAAASNQRLQEHFAEFPGVDPSDPGSAGARLEALQSERLQLAQRRAEIEAQIVARERFLTSALFTSPPAGAPASPPPQPPPVLPDTGSAIEQAIRKVEQELADAIVVRRMTSEHPTVKALERKLESLQTARAAVLLSDSVASAPAGPEPDARQRLRAEDPVLAGQRLRVELELDALRGQLAVATDHLREAEERVARFQSLYDRLLQSSGELKQLQDAFQQDVATVGIWRQHLAQLERILAAENEERGTQFALIEEPKENTRAIKPRVSAIFVICLGCGLAAAALLVALAELLDRSFRSAAQVTRGLGLPVLECIGVIATPRVRRRQLLRRLVWVPALGVLMCAVGLSASMAYASLELPELHRRAVVRLDGLLRAVGGPPTFLAPQAK